MRAFVVAIAIFGVFAGAVQAADDSSIAGKLPDNERGQQVFLFILKKNGISIRMSPQNFCKDLGYGEAAKSSDADKGFWERANDEVGKDGKPLPGELAWVVCQFTAKPKKDTP